MSMSRFLLTHAIVVSEEAGWEDSGRCDRFEGLWHDERCECTSAG